VYQAKGVSLLAVCHRGGPLVLIQFASLLGWRAALQFLEKILDDDDAVFGGRRGGLSLIMRNR
jgi:hypothetical protein